MAFSEVVMPVLGWRRKHKAGFTLLELGVVIIILSLLASGALAIATQKTRLAKQEEMLQKLNAIENALQSYRKSYNRLPCPANIALAESNNNFGFEAANPGSCIGGTPAATFDDGGNSVGGMLPVNTLGLPMEYAYDPWGGRILYAVDERITAADAFTTYPAYDANIGQITIANVTSRGVAIVLSHGPNGHGAYQVNATRKSYGSVNTDEQENCDCNASAVTGAFDQSFVLQVNTTSTAGVLDSFDDIGRAYTRQQFISVSEDTLTEEK